MNYAKTITHRRENQLTIKINDYAEFVDETTSDASKHHIALIFASIKSAKKK